MVRWARKFFPPGNLWWDGRDGYRLVGGRTVFRDPSVTERSPSALIAEVDDLCERLDEQGLRLIWTLFGKKMIAGGPDDRPPLRRTFSQVAQLKDDGTVMFDDLVFFDDYDQNTGPESV